MDETSFGGLAATALVAIDDPAISADLSRRLVAHGFSVHCCRDPVAAADLFKQAKPELVIVDWLAGHFDGLTLCHKIRAQAVEGLPIVWIVSDRPGACDDPTVVEAGVDECLLLPLDVHWSQVRLAAVGRRIEELKSLRQTEEALRQTNERLDLAVVGADEGLWDARPLPGVHWSSPETEVWFSPRAKALMGFADDELPNVLGSWSDRLHPDDQERVLAALTDHIDRRQPYDTEYRLRTKQGEYRWFAARGQARWNAAGQFTRMSGVIRDVTERRRIADALAASEAKWRSLVEHAPDIIAVTTLDGIILSVNHLLPGNTMERVIGSSVYDHVAPEHRELVCRTTETVARTGEPAQVELAIVNEEGVTSWISSRTGPVYDAQGRIEAVMSITTDITSRKLAEQERAKFFALVENSGDFIGIMTPAGRLTYLNPAGRAMLGLADEASVRGALLADYYTDESRRLFVDVALPALKTTERWAEELQLRGRGGSLLDVHQKMFVIERGADGGPVALATIARDIADRKRSEATLRNEQESLRRLLDLQERERRLVAYEIHDGMVQQMTAALMHLEAAHYVEAPEQREAEFDSGQRLLRVAVNEARRLISGLRPPVLDELGITAAIEYLVNEARAHVRDVALDCHVRFSRLAPPLESAIFRIVQEALTNIRKHSGAERARVELREEGPRLRLVVRDWGRGFDPTTVARDRFGLQGIRQRARLLDTVAHIESTPGKGTLVVVDLPLIHAADDEVVV